jgi:hypothetical protein
MLCALGHLNIRPLGNCQKHLEPIKRVQQRYLKTLTLTTVLLHRKSKQLLMQKAASKMGLNYGMNEMMVGKKLQKQHLSQS